MNWESTALVLGIIVGIITVIGAIVSYVWSANKMAFFAGQFLSKIDQIGVSFARFEKGFEAHMQEEKAQSMAMWKKMDGHGDKLIEHEQRIQFVERNINDQ